jgi:hypothetical protein
MAAENMEGSSSDRLPGKIDEMAKIMCRKE